MTHVQLHDTFFRNLLNLPVAFFRKLSDLLAVLFHKLLYLFAAVFHELPHLPVVLPDAGGYQQSTGTGRKK